MLHSAPPDPKPVDGRSCGTCTLCCKVYDVPSVHKPAGQWCRHCQPGRGCGIYEQRPDHCRTFHCLWIEASWLGPEWKPDRCKMVATIDPATKFLFIQVDPGAPAAWKREPYYSQLRAWAKAGLRERRHVVVFINKSATVVLPDREVALGVMGPGDRVVVRERMTPAGPTLEVERGAAG